MPLVSVVIPTRNRARLLRRTLQSACGQANVDLEVIVVDDGSSDATPQAVRDARDDRIRYVRNDTAQGVGAARNRGISSAAGEWIAFLDDDDLWAPQKLDRQLEAATKAGARWAYAGDVNVDEGLRVLSGAPPPAPEAVIALLPRWNPLSSGGSNVIVRSDVLHAVGGFDATLRRTEDWDLWIRLANTGLPACVSDPLVAYRFHSGNVALDVAGMVDEARQLASRYGIPVDIAAMHRRAAWTALRDGRRALAISHYARAVARGDSKSVARAAVALFHPAVGSNRLFGLLENDPAWRAKAERWLAAFATHASTELRHA